MVELRKVQSKMCEKYEGPPPFPLTDSLTEPFWRGAAERRLMILRCEQCGTYIHPPRPVCRNCLSMDLAPEQVSGLAELYSWVIVEQAFHPYFVDKIPYVWASVELCEQRGLRVMTNVVDCPHDELRLGLPVAVTFHDVAEGLTLPMFKRAHQ